MPTTNILTHSVSRTVGSLPQSSLPPCFIPGSNSPSNCTRYYSSTHHPYHSAKHDIITLHVVIAAKGRSLNFSNSTSHTAPDYPDYCKSYAQYTRSTHDLSSFSIVNKVRIFKCVASPPHLEFPYSNEVQLDKTPLDPLA